MRPVDQISTFRDELGGWTFQTSWSVFLPTILSGQWEAEKEKFEATVIRKKCCLPKGAKTEI